MNSGFLKRIKKDTEYRIKTFLILSLVFNFAYSIFLFIISQIFSSKWFLVMYAYYTVLSIVRLFIFFQTAPNKTVKKRIITMYVCGIFLFLVNVVVSVMTFILIYTAVPIKHHEITVITLATYTFSALASAIVSSVKQIRQNNHVFSCIKLVSLISASVSMVNLTNVMLATFGDGGYLRNIILPIFSGVVSIFIIFCAILMTRKAVFDLRELKNEKERQ